MMLDIGGKEATFNCTKIQYLTEHLMKMKKDRSISAIKNVRKFQLNNSEDFFYGSVKKNRFLHLKNPKKFQLNKLGEFLSYRCQTFCDLILSE